MNESELNLVSGLSAESNCCPRHFDYIAAKDGIGAEIGVAYGEHAKTLLEIAKPRKLHLIDPYQFYGQEPQSQLDEIKQIGTRDVVGPVEWHFTPSVVAAQEIKDQFDWVYIDGNHGYDAVLADIYSWWPKVKSGSRCILGGHDFDQFGLRMGLVQAVLKFVNEFNLQLNYKISDWWVFKE